MNNDLLFLTVGESFSLFSVSEGKPEGMNISGDLLSRSSSNGVVQRVSHSVPSQQPLNALCIRH